MSKKKATRKKAIRLLNDNTLLVPGQIQHLYRKLLDNTDAKACLTDREQIDLCVVFDMALREFVSHETLERVRTAYKEFGELADQFHDKLDDAMDDTGFMEDMDEVELQAETYTNVCGRLRAALEDT